MSTAAPNRRSALLKTLLVTAATGLAMGQAMASGTISQEQAIKDVGFDVPEFYSVLRKACIPYFYMEQREATLKELETKHGSKEAAWREFAKTWPTKQQVMDSLPKNAKPAYELWYTVMEVRDDAVKRFGPENPGHALIYGNTDIIPNPRAFFRETKYYKLDKVAELIANAPAPARATMLHMWCNAEAFAWQGENWNSELKDAYRIETLDQTRAIRTARTILLTTEGGTPDSSTNHANVMRAAISWYQRNDLVDHRADPTTILEQYAKYSTWNCPFSTWMSPVLKPVTRPPALNASNGRGEQPGPRPNN